MANINQAYNFQLFNTAKIISIIFHPMIFSLFVFIIIIFDNHIIHPQAFNIIMTCFLFSNLLPIMTLFLLQKKGLISDLDASIREERIMPLFLGVVYAIFGFLLLELVISFANSFPHQGAVLTPLA